MNTPLDLENTSTHDVLKGTFEISLESAKVINYAGAQNNIPVVRRLLIQNNSDHIFRNVELLVTSNPQFFEPRRLVRLNYC